MNLINLAWITNTKNIIHRHFNENLETHPSLGYWINADYKWTCIWNYNFSSFFLNMQHNFLLLVHSKFHFSSGFIEIQNPNGSTFQLDRKSKFYDTNSFQNYEFINIKSLYWIANKTSWDKIQHYYLLYDVNKIDSA